jgi:HlyD family secretion protein
VVVDVDNTAGKLRPYMTPKLLFEVAHRNDVLLIPDQALRWQPTWNQISPAARTGLTPPGSGNKKASGGEEAGSEEATVDTGVPTVWIRAEDGLVRPVTVKLGITDGIDTELVGGDLQAKDVVVIGAVRAAQPDFISSFVNKVIKK